MQRVDTSSVSMSISKDSQNHGSSSGMLVLFHCTSVESVRFYLTFVSLSAFEFLIFRYTTL